MAVRYDPLLDEIRIKDNIPQRDADPSNPKATDAWILRSGGGTDGVAGSPRGLLLALTYSGDVTPSTYQFSYRTKEATTVRVALS